MNQTITARQVTPPQICIFGGLAGLLGVLMMGSSFAINAGPPLGSSSQQLTLYARQHLPGVVWGAWLQAVGPWLITLFALVVVHLAGAAQRLAGWMTLLGAGILMMVSLSEVTIYLSALAPEPANMAQISADLGHAIQHLYFIVGAPALFLPLGLVILSSTVLPKYLGYLALFLGFAFVALGLASIYTIELAPAVTAFAAVQSLWWCLAAITLMFRSRVIAQGELAAGSAA